MKYLRYILLVFTTLIPALLFSQVDIKISIENQQDSIYYLYKYIGDKTAIADTAFFENGIIRIAGKNKLPEGIYLLTNENKIPLTEILIGKKQKFTLKINDLNDLSSFEAKGAKETEIYFKLMDKIKRTELNITALENETEYYPENDNKIDSLKRDLAKFEESLKINKKNAFINIFINSLKRRSLENYWDDFALNDKRILTYPLIYNKLETYFDCIAIDSDTINSAIDYLIGRTEGCVEVRDYLIWYFYGKYYSPKYMNLDDVYIHLAKEYFAKLEMENVSKGVADLIVERANYLENLKLGAKIPEIGNLYSIESQYIALIFYDKTCKKCAQEGRILESLSKKYPEMKIFPVEVHSSNQKNLFAMYDIQTTPLIYILDNQKNIIAKRIKAEQVEQFINKNN